MNPINLLSSLINASNKLFDFLKSHFYLSLILFAIFFFFKTKKNFKESKDFLIGQYGMIIIDGKFGKGKNRFMTTLAKNALDEGYFILSNFYNGYTDIRWNSLTDLRTLLYDVWLLGEYQNFTDDELQIMYIGEGKERYKIKLKERLNIRKKYKNIPYNGFYNRFLFLADEFQNLFYNRGAMGNFSGKNKDFLKLLHQVRHFNSMMIFATQEASELDVKFRKLSTYYATMDDYFNEMFFGYNVYSFTTDKEHNLDIEKASKYTSVPAVFFNGYKLNKIINRFELLIKRKIKFRFASLDFFSKFNADPDHNIYNQGDLFLMLDKYYKDKKMDYKVNIV